MLKLTRNIGETVVISDDIYCTILEFKGNQVRLGFDAPRTLPVHRKEIHDRIQLENEIQTTEEEEHESIIDGLIAKFKRQQPNQLPALSDSCGV